jgi:hypothetical protein
MIFPSYQYLGIMKLQVAVSTATLFRSIIYTCLPDGQLVLVDQGARRGSRQDSDLHRPTCWSEIYPYITITVKLRLRPRIS